MVWTRALGLGDFNWPGMGGKKGRNKPKRGGGGGGGRSCLNYADLCGNHHQPPPTNHHPHPKRETSAEPLQHKHAVTHNGVITTQFSRPAEKEDILWRESQAERLRRLSCLLKATDRHHQYCGLFLLSGSMCLDIIKLSS